MYELTHALGSPVQEKLEASRLHIFVMMVCSK